ncbi:hypothetical protein CQW23_16605 [Capsicum baccatum]|uniref:Leucine-rich repeat-containing N-terminal plant-type domain-containing protein n=1 Tax=Capsicum baccatum TaxID=33114 RepID=A0A2G2WBU2_CAPBA|nr:hypothetical protein CQW23_16605 [Capsicum baccatum]
MRNGLNPTWEDENRWEEEKSSRRLRPKDTTTNERLALLQFKHQFSSTGSSYVSTCCAAYSKTSLWNESSSDYCIWDGVTCHDSTGHVIGLDLTCSQLQGTFNQNSSLFQLHHLRVLNLAFNNFSGSLIPAEIGWLKNLVQRNLSFSSFSGRVPSNISYLVNLVSLDLSSTSLQLDEMTFTNVLGNLTKLEVLSLSSVNISSKMPLNVSSSLTYLDVQGTELLNEFPLSSFSFPNLQTLSLSSNLNLYLDLTKFNWSSVSSSLLELDLSYTNTTGKLPDSLGNVKSLKYLRLSNCKLFGSIPENIGNLKQVMEMDLSHNNLSGHLPWTISKLKRLTEFV